MKAVVVEVLGRHSMLVGTGQVEPDGSGIRMERVEACVRYSRDGLSTMARAARAAGCNFAAYSTGVKPRTA
jgi:hypothetical protein